MNVLDTIEIAEGVFLSRAQPADKAYSLLQRLGQADEVMLELVLRKNIFQVAEYDNLKRELTRADMVVVYGIDTHLRGHPLLPTTIIAPANTDFKLHCEYYRSSKPRLPVKSISFSAESLLPQDFEGSSIGSITSLVISERQKYVIHGTGDYIPNFLKHSRDFSQIVAMIVPFSVYQKQREKMVRYIGVADELNDKEIQAVVRRLFGECDTCSHVPLETLRAELLKRFKYDLVENVPNPRQDVGEDWGLYRVAIDGTVKKVGFGPLKELQTAHE